MKTGMLILLASLPLTLAASQGELAKGFTHPPPTARPWVYWFWMNGNITSNGISADLEAMHRAGVGGVLIMEVDSDTPQGPVAFGSREWRGLFQYACAEASRHGVEVRMNNDAGFCGSGGPWITPELSMQKLVWTETIVTSASDLATPLAQPKAVENFYRDIAVLAFPTPAEDAVRMADFDPKLSASAGAADFEAGKLTDGDPDTTIALPQPLPDKPSFIQAEFNRPFTARQMTLSMPVFGDAVLHGVLQSSDDGQTFHTVREFDVVPSTKVFNFPGETARFFRVCFQRKNPDVERFTISEFELSPRLRIESIEAKALFARKNYYPGPSEFPGRARYTEPAPDLVLERTRILDLTQQMDSGGRLRWTPPAGCWTVLRLGHTSTGVKNHPAPEAGHGLECDKLSRAGAEAAFAGLMNKVVADAGPLAGKTLVSTHIDSWEVGSQNWTATLPAEFRQRRGYDLLPYLAVMAGRVVDSAEISERFLHDLRRTVSELVADNYAGHLRDLAHRRGLALSMEAYDGPNDDLTYAGRADEPMGEFWTWSPFDMSATCPEMASAAHVYGKRIVGAEAFTALDAEKWLGHPSSIKVFGDWAFCEGINRFVIHRYALQPWTDPAPVPGMSFSSCGVRFERTQTWWEQSRAWSDYLARCQYLLQQGLAVADICCLAPEQAPRRWRAPKTAAKKDGYSLDGCPAEVLLTRMAVRDGKLVLPDGMTYRLLALQETETMTPELLRRIRELAAAGATVVGAPPLKSPSLSGYPDCDAAVASIARELWGETSDSAVIERRVGKGRIIRGLTPQQVLAADGVAPDFIASTAGGPADFNYAHRSLPGAEVYFVANMSRQTEEAVCSFRVSNSSPELWRPDTGRIERPGVYEAAQNPSDASRSRTARKDSMALRMPLRLEPSGSVFVVFPRDARPRRDRIVSVKRDGVDQPVASTELRPTASTSAGSDGSNTFTIAFWVKPEIGTSLPKEAVFGKSTYFDDRNEVVYPFRGHFVYHSPDHAGAGVSVGTNGVWVTEHSADYWGSPLVWPTSIIDWTHVAVVYEDARPRLYLDGMLVHEGLRSTCTVHCSVGVSPRNSSAPFVGGLGPVFHDHRAYSAAEVTALMASTPRPVPPPRLPVVELCSTERGHIEAAVWQPGRYTARTAAGREWRFEVAHLPEPMELTGSWQVGFPPGAGAPAAITLDRLLSWSEHPDEGVRHFSGTATYSKEFEVPAGWLAPGQRLYLDLGDVAVMAEVFVNEKNLGTLWKPPFRLEITAAARAGKNRVEARVVNLWINRMIGDEDLPEDSPRNPNGSLKEWPEWLRAGRPSPTGRFTFTSYRLWKKGSPLQHSGLLGPVSVIPVAQVAVGK